MRWLRESRVVSVGLWLVAAVVAVAAAARLTGLAAGTWPVAPSTAFTLYAVPVALVAALIALALMRRWPAVVLTVAAVALGFTAVSRATPDAQPQATGPQLRVTSANLLRGQADARALAAIVDRRRPDVLAMQEFMPGSERKLRAAGVLDDLPYLLRRPAGGRRDTALASRWPLERLQVEGLPDVYLAGRAQLPPTSAEPQGRSVPLISAHPLPPILPGWQDPWERWLAAMPGPHGPLAGGVVAGDFNATLDHAQFRSVLSRGWRDAAEERGQGLRPTWKGGSSLTPTTSLRLTIDHVLAPPGAAVRSYVVDGLPGSDHRAITATIVLPELPQGRDPDRR